MGVEECSFGLVVVFATVLSNVVIGATSVSFGVLYIEYIEAFGQSQAVTGWVGSVCAFMSRISGLFMSGIVIRYGCRPTAVAGGFLISLGLILSSFAINTYYLYVSYGFISGIGLGCLAYCNVMIVLPYFSKRRALAVGLSLVGMPIGGMAGSMLSRIWIDSYGWRGTLRLLAGISLHSIPLAGLYRPHTLKNIAGKQSTTFSQYLRNLVDTELLKRADFILFCLCSASTVFCYSMYYSNMPSRAVSVGMSYKEASMLSAITSISSGIGRPTLSFIASLRCTNRLHMYAVLPLISSIAAGTSGIVKNFPYFAVGAVVIGIVNGSLLSLCPAIEIDLLGQEKIYRGHAMMGILLGIVSLVTTPLAGFIYDVTGNYDIPFLLVCVVQFLGSGCIWLIAISKRLNLEENKLRGITMVQTDEDICLPVITEMGSMAHLEIRKRSSTLTQPPDN